jgi:hypothetical protein
VGIIDINGQTIVSPDYDGIVLYDHFFALLRKGEKYGIADLKNRKTILFNDINIKKPESVDSFGRFIYTDGDCNNQTNNKGVIGPKGIIVPSGKYSHIELLKNGLIEVSNEENTLYGLLNLKGKELLKMEFSYISSFNYGYATVCIGGYYEEDILGRELVGGKWGIIDKTGKIIVECIHDEEQPLIDGKNIAADSIETPENNLPKILCSDYIPNSISEEVGYYGNSYYDVYDDDTSSVYDNPYYNDNLDMDQQSIEFWNNL